MRDVRWKSYQYSSYENPTQRVNGFRLLPRIAGQHGSVSAGSGAPGKAMISLMFHSAGLRDLPWRSLLISEPLDIIRNKLEVIREDGYETLFMREAAASAGRRRDKLIHLCFDDGYLDNWVHVFPLLKEFNLKATVFVTAEFIHPGDAVRPQKAVFERRHDPRGCCAGFLSFAEMRAMESSGLVEIQSHALSHTWYFKGPNIVDFWHPQAATEQMGPVWMLWNRFPDRKPFYLSEAGEIENRIPYGTPIYEHGKSLATLRFHPDESALEERLIELAGSKREEFFFTPDWRDEFHTVVRNHRDRHSVKGTYESGPAQEERFRKELAESKERIEAGLGHPIDGLCFPGGGLTDIALRIARESDYKYFILPRVWGKEKDPAWQGQCITRIGCLPNVNVRGRDFGYPSKDDFRHYLRLNNGYKRAAVLFQRNRVKRLLHACVRGRTPALSG